MNEDKSPIEKAVELAVYAPIGFFNFIKNMLPGWIEGGRQEVTKQVTTARALSEIAVTQGRKEAEKAAAQTAEVVSNLAARRAGANKAPSGPSAPSAPKPAPAPAAPPAPTAASTPTSAASPPSSNGGGPAPSADGLAIPGYDALAASQVVQRLGGLSAAELEAVRNYEAATRGRRTILNRVEQLQTEGRE